MLDREQAAGRAMAPESEPEDDAPPPQPLRDVAIVVAFVVVFFGAAIWLLP